MLQEVPQDLSRGLRDPGSAELARESCEFVYRRLFAAAGGSVAVSVILSAFLWRSQPAEVVISWQVLMVVLAAFLAGLAWAYRRSADGAEHAKVWVRRLAIGA